MPQAVKMVPSKCGRTAKALMDCGVLNKSSYVVHNKFQIDRRKAHGSAKVELR